jgi:hypothetical protein
MRLAWMVVVAGCTSLQAENQLCPPGSPGPVPNVSQPQTLGEGENHPVAIAAVGATTLWLDQGPPTQTSDEGTVVARDLCSGKQTILVRQKQSRPSALVVDQGLVYWVNAARDNGMGSLMKVDVQGAMPELQLSKGEKRPSAIAIDGGTIYFVNEGDIDATGVFVPGTGQLRKYENGQATTLVDGLDAPTGVAVRNGVVMWSAAGQGALVDIDGNGVKIPTFAEGTGSIEKLENGQRTVLAMGLNAPIAVAKTEQHNFWMERGVKRGTGKLSRDDTMIAGGLDFPGDFTVDGDDFYTAETGSEDEIMEGKVFRDHLGVPEVQIAASQQLPRAITTDAHLLYWVNFGRLDTPDGQVLARWKAAP